MTLFLLKFVFVLLIIIFLLLQQVVVTFVAYFMTRTISLHLKLLEYADLTEQKVQFISENGRFCTSFEALTIHFLIGHAHRFVLYVLLRTTCSSYKS